ncbi:(-)-germacrene D synthase-like isoform X2 [Durio zibethinus]|uniref:(-)-germacrene D synthase-like isoform X2 n=1 Tax=Durio zibethinus TaxID=66656 RepID=A0A6P5WMH5_DURZI|nr:(-)-germacrene D synthase-like isoform X2 [Durio zibethinus]
MSIEVSAVTLSSPIQNAELPEINRRSAGYHPSIWGDHFLSYASNINREEDHDKEEEHQKLKNELQKMLMADEVDKPLEKLKLIDAIQRLGVSYHFEKEIEQVLHLAYNDCDIGVNDGNLYTISLEFRLLRQNGYKMSCEAFNKFKDSEGKLKESLINDVQGMLSLYEATHLRVHGEDILDEALAFTTTHLETMATSCLNSSLAAQISHALKQPIHKGLPRLEARQYMPIYQEDPSHNEAVLTFAKLDFNMLQRVHQKELSEIAKWWKDLDFLRKLPFIRDRVIECYFWILGVYFEPEYRLARSILTKVIAMTSVIDDIYDVYGTLEELVLFTKAVERSDFFFFFFFLQFLTHVYPSKFIVIVSFP